jgi:hypothetical protein
MRVALLLMTQPFYTISPYLYARVVQRNLRLLVVLVGMVDAGCQTHSTAGVAVTSDADDVWPDAPRPTATNETRRFRYQPANIGRCRMVGDSASSDPRNRTFKMSADLDFRAGTTSAERNIHIETFDWTSKALTDISAMRISADELYLNTHGQESDVQWFQRSGIDVAALTESPIAIATFDDSASAFRVRPNPEYPLEKLGGMGNMLDDGLSLLPDLPREPISPGHHWSIARNGLIDTTSPARVTIDFEYLGDSRCPSGVGACAVISFKASTPSFEMLLSNGDKMRAAHRLAGKAFFNYERGAIDESRERVMIEGESGGKKVTFVTNYSIASRT